MAFARTFTLVLAIVLTFYSGSLIAKEGPSDALDQYGKTQPWKGDPGRVTVIDFAASWCAPCIKSLPRLDKLAAANPEVTVIVVSIDKAKKGRDFLVKELALRLPVLWDQNYAIAEHYEPPGMPTTIVLDAQGQEIGRHVGFSERQWRELVHLVQTRKETPAPRP